MRNDEPPPIPRPAPALRHEYRPNEIESLVEYELTRLEHQITLLRKSLLVSRRQPRQEAWSRMVSEIREIQSATTKLEVVNVGVRYAVEGSNPHEGVDG